MKKTVLTVLLVVAAAFAVTAFVSAGAHNSAGAVQAAAGTDSQPVGQPEVVIPEQFRAAPDAPAAVSPATVYFTPQDENTSATVLFLYNTGTAAATVGIQGFGLTGVLGINTTVSVPAKHLVRIVSDTVSTVSGSWQTPVLVNFTTSTTYAKLTLPDGVKAEAYVAWNGGDTFDPLAAVPTLPIRFSTDAASLFLPSVQR